MGDGEKFWDVRAEKYAQSAIKDMAAYEKTLERTRAHLTPDMRVLELGCGTGTTALKLADAVGDYAATDYSAEMIAIAERKLADAGVRILTFERADVFDDRLARSGYDAVLAFNLLHLLRDLPAVAARIRALLKPDGLFISKSACLKNGASWMGLALPVMRMLGRAPYVAFFSVDDLEATIAKAGFDVIETGDYPDKKPPSRFVVARKN